MEGTVFYMILLCLTIINALLYGCPFLSVYNHQCCSTSSRLRGVTGCQVEIIPEALTYAADKRANNSTLLTSLMQILYKLIKNYHPNVLLTPPPPSRVDYF